MFWQDLVPTEKIQPKNHTWEYTVKEIIAIIVIISLSILIVFGCNPGKDTTSSVDDIDDRVIAYSYPPSSGTNEIYIVTETGSDRLQLTDSPHRNLGPAWSPDGSQIAFYTHEQSNDMNWLLYIMDSDGSNRQQLTFGDNIRHHQVAWSPDGSQLAFTQDDGNSFEIWLMNPDGTNQHRIENVNGAGPCWSHNGSKIYYNSMFPNGWGDDIMVMDSDGANQINITNDDFRNWEPDLSPDGSQLAFISSRDGNEEIYIMDSDGPNLSRLTNHDAWDSGPEWSEDGERIMFVSQRSGTFDIYIINVDGTGFTRLTNTSSHAIQPDWLKIIN